MKSAFYLVIFSTLMSMSQQAYAYPKVRVGDNRNVPLSVFNSGYDFEGIVALSNCSGSLIQLENSRDNDFGLILTNGHCHEDGFIPNGKTLVNIPSSRQFGLLNTNAQKVGTLNATKVVYGTMTKTDVTIYKLRETYAGIKSAYGIRPWTLSSHAPAVNDPAQVISGYWKRGYSCSISAIIEKLKEGEWVNEKSLRYSQPGCETIGGTSGSPLVLSGTRIVIGVNNTGNDDGEACTENNPCEIDANGNVTYQKGYSYAQQTYWLYGCLDAKNELDLLRPGCELPH